MPKVRSTSGNRDSTHIPRPPNAFMIYRRERSKFQQPAGQDRNQGHISKEIAAKWKALPPAEKAIWEQKAKIAKEEHARQYPGYKFQPKQKNKKVDPPKRESSPRSPSDNEREPTPPPPTPPLTLFPVDPPFAPLPPINWDFCPLEQEAPLDNSTFVDAGQLPEHQLQFNFMDADLGMNQLDMFTVPPPAFVPQPIASVEVSYANHAGEPNFAAPIIPESLLSQTEDFSFLSSLPSTSALPPFPTLTTGPHDFYFPATNDFSGFEPFHLNGNLSFPGLDAPVDFSFPPVDSTQDAVVATSNPASSNDQDQAQQPESYPVPSNPYIPPPGASNVLRRVGANWKRAVVGAR